MEDDEREWVEVGVDGGRPGVRVVPLRVEPLSREDPPRGAL